MFSFIVGLVCTVLAAVAWELLQTYRAVPAGELKRQARHGDPLAQLLYRAAAFGASLRVLLGGLAGLFGALALVSFTAAVGLWWAIILLVVLVGIGSFVFAPSESVNRGSLWLARSVAPGIAWLLERIHPVLDAGVRVVRKRRPASKRTGLYEKADLVGLLEQQKEQPGNRIALDEIDLLEHALTFGDKLVRDVLVPLRVVDMVATGDAIGPVLMDELAKSGHSRFPVYEGAKTNVVGVLYLRQLVGKRQGGTVAGVMSQKLTYVHEDFTLRQALQAFLKTKRHLFLVVNGFEELVGILTIEDVLEQVIGSPIMDEFDAYEDMRAVATAAARKDHVQHQKAKSEPQVPTVQPAVVSPTVSAEAEATPEPQEVIQ